MIELERIIKKLLILLVLLGLGLPYLQNQFHFVELSPLKGAITIPEKPKFSFKDWFTGSYQTQQDQYLTETFGFRNLCIRLNNQIAYSFFKKAKANGVIIGLENYLFEENYIKAYYGRDFVGHDSITNTINKLSYIQDTLRKRNKNIILVFAAGKGSFYPEYIPHEYRSTKGPTNYETFVQKAHQKGLSYIDFNRYFIEQKHKAPYPLYPQYGIHWSYYGMCLAADSMIKYIEQLRSIDMPNIFWDSVAVAAPKESDYDVADGMNIKFKLKSFNMAYPNVRIVADSHQTKPSVLVVSDSYYWGMFNFGISNAFSNSHFWFYNKEVYPDSYQNPIQTHQLNLQEQIDQHDVIIIMATEATLPKLGWGFIENTYALFSKSNTPQAPIDSEFQIKVQHLRNYIQTDAKWMEQIISKAKQNKISTDSMLTLDAIWQIKHQKH